MRVQIRGDRMPELQMDVAVANRFISSLSKSLQALCHGCMDFDTGIEIVGYINVNIDSGSKVDYVLNEKVLKSTTNSMTFVSNSFLAKKDQPKQTRDGACSPVPELQQPTPVSSPYRVRGAYYGSQPRATAPFSHSYVLHGSQKRSWAGMEKDWKMSPKRQRAMPRETSPSSAMSSQYPALVQNQTDSNFRWPQTPTRGSQADTSSEEGQTEVNIKKEVFDSEIEHTTSNEQEQSQTSDQDANDQSERTDDIAKINIKKDPDAVTSANSEMPASDGGDTDSADFKGTFLEPSASEGGQQNQDASDMAKTSENNQESSTISLSDLAATGQNTNAALNEEAPDNTVSADQDTTVEYDEAGDDGAYPQSVYSDAGEGASDSGQFEVIEIDDEDEDVQAMFGESRLNDIGNRRKRRQVLKTSKKASLLRAASYNHPGEHTQEAVKVPHGAFVQGGAESLQPQLCAVEICSICRIALPIGVTYQQHVSEIHTTEAAGATSIGSDPFTCEICYKGFVTKERLRQHSSVHNSSFYSCFICDVKFKHKKNIKRHLESTHGLRKCSYCMALYKKGSEFNNHIVNCHGTMEAPCLI